MTFEVIHKPTFQNQLRALPKERRLQVLDKIEVLQDDPSPHAPQKKQLHGYKDRVYRLRSGDFRIFYTYGNGWVTLLGVSDRKDAYRGEQVTAEGPGFDISELPTEEWVPEPERRFEVNGKGQAFAVDDEAFARPIDDELLERLRVPTQYRAALHGLATFDELAAAHVPEPVKALLLDAVLEPNYEQVLQQPDLITGDPSDLLKFAEGELLGFLLRLDPDQERFVDWALSGSGPTLVKGGPGTGKSTIALYRARSILHLLRQQGVECPRILFTTYTAALTAASEQLLKKLLGDDAALVDVRTADSVAHRLVSASEGKLRILDSKDLPGLLKDAMSGVQIEGNALVRRKQLATLDKLSQEYLLEEITQVIEARALSSLTEYLGTPRAGRKVRLTEVQRGAVWRVYEAFDRLLKRRGVWTWGRIRRRGAELAHDPTARRYDAVIVDEAQDLDATVLRMLVGLCTAPDRIFVTADANQSIYGSGFRWTDVHADLRFQGRTGVLRKNYRTTREIGEAAQAYLKGGALDEDDVERSYAQFDGPLPTVRSAANSAAETDLLVRFLRLAAREARQGIGACAVLVPSETAGRAIAERLTAAGLAAEFMPGRALDLEKPVVKILTLQSAKGLEFPVVAIAGFLDTFPQAGGKGGEAEETEEALARQRRVMFVAMTRAMRALLVLAPEKPSPLFDGFDDHLWNTTAVAATR